MCCLFALQTGGDRDVPLDLGPRAGAGHGLVAFTSKGGLIIVRDPLDATGDAACQAVAERLVAAQAIAHRRDAVVAPPAPVDADPFIQDGRAFAHDGAIGDLDRIEERLGSNRAMVMGATDSERFFSLITLAIREARDDVRRGIRAAIAEAVESYEIYSLNFVMAEPGHVWAFRYPEHNPLHILRRRSPTAPTVVISSEQIGAEPGWEEVASGELIHVGPRLEVTREIAVTGPPEHLLVLTGPAGEGRPCA